MNYLYRWKILRSTNPGTPKTGNCFQVTSDWVLSYCESQWEGSSKQLLYRESGFGVPGFVLLKFCDQGSLVFLLKKESGKDFQKVLLLASRISNDQTISFRTKCKKKLQCGPCQTTMLPRVLEFSAIKYDLSVDKPNEF
jgi:hypothetical protein